MRLSRWVKASTAISDDKVSKNAFVKDVGNVRYRILQDYANDKNFVKIISKKISFVKLFECKEN